MRPKARESLPRRLYLDTSAYLCVLLGEEGWREVSDLTEGAELCSSVLLVLEARRNLIRLAREGALDAARYDACLTRLSADSEQFVLRDLTLDLCVSSIVPAVVTPRSLDLAHLRSALWFHAEAPLERFLTLDAAQGHAARELGLPVSGPGVPR